MSDTDEAETLAAEREARLRVETAANEALASSVADPDEHETAQETLRAVTEGADDDASD